MEYKRIIPCLDVKDGKVVKGKKFEQPVYVGDPVELARKYNAQGADELVFLDITATLESRATLLDCARKVAAELSIPFCIGGGIRTVDDAAAAIKAGAAKVSVCSSALARPALLSEMAAAFGVKSVMLAIDAKRVSAKGEAPRWNAFSRGGQTDTGLDAVEWAVQAEKLGAGEITLNSIDADGTESGYDIGLCAAIADAVSIPVVASSGAGSLEQIADVFKKTRVASALVASLLHFEKTTVKEIKQYLTTQGIRVRE